MTNDPLQQREREFEFSQADFRFIADLILDKTGIDLADSKQNLVYTRIVRRIRALNLASFKDYCSYLESPKGEAELMDFINALTTNLTRFFRENHHFEHLQNSFIPSLAAKPVKKLRIWSAGCSAGMEAYSIAMLLLENLPNIKDWDIRILASDIDTNILETARTGIYAQKEAELIPASMLKKYTTKATLHNEPAFEVTKKVKQFVRFNHLNLFEPWPIKGEFDAIFCRNVLIYFNKETQVPLIANFANHLPKDGLLYLGHSENAQQNADVFRLIGRTIYTRI